MPEIIISLISLGGSLVISAGGIFINQKLVIYRLEQLEKAVDKYNNLNERTYSLEKDSEVFCEKIQVANHRIADLEKKLEEMERRG